MTLSAALLWLCLAEALCIVVLLWSRRGTGQHIQQSPVERLKFERLLSDLATTFISLSEKQVEANINRGLHLMAGFLDVERVALYELSQAKTELTATSWIGDGIHPPRIAVADHPEYCAQLLERSDVLFASDPAAHAAAASFEQDYCQKAGIVWAASVPLRAGGETIGAMKLASTTRQLPWTVDVVARLTVVAEIFANAVTRKRATHELSDAERRHAQDVQSESEERFRLVANTAPVMIWMSDTTKLCTYFNKQWLDFVGRPMSAELGNGWVDGVHADDLPGCFGTYVEAFDRHESFTMQYRLLRYDGEYRWLLDHGVPRFDHDGGFAGYIGSCVDLTDSKKTEAALATFSRRLLDAQERERARIARELHDDINQRLALLAIELQSLDADSPSAVRARSAELFQRTVTISSDVQALSHRLHSSKLEYLGIGAAMRGFCAEFTAQQQVTVDFQSSGLPTHLPRDVSLCLFRILQEALHNAAKHSGGRHVEARLQGTSAVVRLTIRDRGRGFDTQAAMNGRGLGLISMRERVSLVNGTMLITSAPGWGTEISVLVPVRAGVESDLQTVSSDRTG